LSGLEVSAPPKSRLAGMGLVRRFSRPLIYFFDRCPVVLHGGALFLPRFARRKAPRLGLCGVLVCFRPIQG
jgi:hypothetical protein